MFGEAVARSDLSVSGPIPLLARGSPTVVVLDDPARFRRAFDAAPVGTALVGTDGTCRDVNPALCRTLGYLPQQLLGRNLGELVHPDDRAVEERSFAALLAGLKEPATRHVDERFVTGDGRVIWVAVRRRLVREGDAPAYVVVQVVDVTHRHAQVAALQERLASLEDLNLALADFAGRASHDLKSPLVAIGGFASTLRARWRELDDADREEMLDRVASATARAAAMVSELLDEARNADAIGTRPRLAVDPMPLIESAVGLAGLAPEEVSVEGDWPPVAMAAADLTSVVSNLLENADHYGRDAEGRLRVRLRGHAEAGRLVVECRDSGPGLPDPERVFEPFYRGPGSTERNPSSTGLGLALVRRAVERWGGSVTGHTGVPRGAVVRLVLPLA